MAEKSKLTPLAGVCILGVSFFGANVLSFVFAMFLEPGDARTFIMYVLPQVANLCAVFFGLKLLHCKPAEILPVKQKLQLVPTALTPLITVATMALSIALLYGFGYLSTKLGISGSVEIPAWDNPVNIILGIICLSLIPAVGEELLFRGALLKSFEPMGGALAIVISALLFSVQHMNVAQLVHQFILGAILGYIVLKTKNIWYAVIIHFLNNVLAQVSNLWQGLNDYLAVYAWDRFGVLFGVSVAGALAVIGLLLLLKRSKAGGYSLAKRERIERMDLIAISAAVGVYLILWILTAVAV